MELVIVHETDTGAQVARKAWHFESVLAPTTSITVRHGLARRQVQLSFMSLEYYELPKNELLKSCLFGDDGSGQYYCRLEFNTPFSGVIRFDY